MARKRETRPELLSEQLRRMILESGLSRNQLCQQTGIDPSHLHRFVHGTGQLTFRTADKIGAALRLRLIVDSDE